ncbi:MAG: acetyl-CoA acetyltransferase [Actinomycetia bacterium]|nr:acetyl-CoA acetyltransferase [Actinomycetes bacterium]
MTRESAAIAPPSRSCHRHSPLPSLTVRPVLLVDAVRTPIGARSGRLSGWHPADLAAEVLRALVERTGLDPAAVDDVVLGCAMPVGNQGFNVARSAVLAAGWPDAVPAGTVDRQAVSSLAAVADAARAVASGACEIVVAGGVEVMSTTPLGATLVPGSVPFGPGVIDRYRDAGGLVPAGSAAEALAVELGLDRAALDGVAHRSHARATAGAEVVPVASRVLDRDKGEVVRPGTTVAADELPRPTITLDELAGARPAYAADGLVTAANSGAIGDGAAAVLLMSETAAAALGATPLAWVRAGIVVGTDPLAMLAGATVATRRILAAAGMAAADVARFEVGEPFAAALVAFERALGVEANPAGGGIALGEPTGAVGARLVATLAHGLAGGWGVATTAGLGGLGAAILLEAHPDAHRAP